MGAAQIVQADGVTASLERARAKACEARCGWSTPPSLPVNTKASLLVTPAALSRGGLLGASGRLVRGWQVVEVFCDNDASAYGGKRRRAYERMLTAVESTSIDAIVTWHNDRLHRSPKELEAFIDLVGRSGVRLAVVTGGDYTKQNVTLAFLFNGIGIPLATTGLVYPVWAMVHGPQRHDDLRQLPVGPALAVLRRQS